MVFLFGAFALLLWGGIFYDNWKHGLLYVGLLALLVGLGILAFHLISTLDKTEPPEEITSFNFAPYNPLTGLTEFEKGQKFKEMEMKIKSLEKQLSNTDWALTHTVDKLAKYKEKEEPWTGIIDKDAYRLEREIEQICNAFHLKNKRFVIGDALTVTETLPYGLRIYLKPVINHIENNGTI